MQELNNKFKVMIVEDSSLIRGYLIRVIEKDPQLEVCCTAENGKVAVDMIKKQDPDVILLDIEMPEMDGLAALPLLLNEKPNADIIMVSSLTSRNAEKSIAAMSMGAADYIEKPSAETDKKEFGKELLSKIKAIVLAHRPINEINNSAPSNIQVATKEQTAAVNVDSSNHNNIIRGFKPEVLAIGSSTGGPQTLQHIFGGIGTKISNIPIFITQHMPPEFTTFLAKTIGQASGLVCIEPETGQKVENGHIYVAPGDYHMLVEKDGEGKVIKLTKDKEENYCRPAVDPMLRSIVSSYGGKGVLTVILTGMGQDGMLGAKAVHENGGKVIIQDEDSSVVWGMPGAIAKEGFQDAIYSKDQLAMQIVKVCKGGL